MPTMAAHSSTMHTDTTTRGPLSVRAYHISRSFVGWCAGRVGRRAPRRSRELGLAHCCALASGLRQLDDTLQVACMHNSTMRIAIKPHLVEIFCGAGHMLNNTERAFRYNTCTTRTYPLADMEVVHWHGSFSLAYAIR